MNNSEFESLSSLINSSVVSLHGILVSKSGSSLSYEKIKDITDGVLKQFEGDIPEVSDMDYQRLLKRVTDNYSSTTGERIIIVADKDASRWFDAKKHEISWNHWEAYKKMLQGNGRSIDIIDDNEKVIDAILDYSGDPREPGKWARKGLVMGNVQSGKTQNYLGLINKAIDAGYKTIIVLGGHLNDLRKQTQERIDEGVLGLPSRHLTDTSTSAPGPIGVGLLHKNNIIPATTTAGDFNKAFADKFGIKLDAGSTVVFVIKKRTDVMEVLYEWIKSNHYLDPKDDKILTQPMIIIDDEADYASVNTKAHKKEVTLTNNLIRQLLSLFSKSTYVAYTATPFANIFIDPDENSYNEHDDLFPSDFMVKIPVPTNYMGQEFFFGDDALQSESNVNSPIIEINDHWPVHELKSKDEVDYTLPESLKDAIRAFVLVTAVRALRGESNSHNTMLVNISHLGKHQNQLEILINSYKEELFRALSAFGSLGALEARKSELLFSLEATYDDKFNIEEKYGAILHLLSGTKRRDVKVWALNQSGRKKDRHELNYSTYKEFGLSVIVIGGHKLSRGLTLEGLSISYFARNSKAYDTLMQMCRWFGYRSDYKDLCKVYLPEEAISWYAFISTTIQELYSELQLMSDRGEKPKDFGLKVREHPGLMLITAKNKVGWGRSETLSQDLWGQTQRRFKFFSDPVRNSNNVEYAKVFLSDLLSKPSSSVYTHTNSGSVLISNIGYKSVIDFINATDLPEDDLGNEALINQLVEMEKAGIPVPKILLFNQNASAPSRQWVKDLLPSDKTFVNEPYVVAPGHQITLPKRSMTLSGEVYRVNSVSLGNSDDEKLFLLPEEQRTVSDSKTKLKAVDHDYIASASRDFVGLKIYFFAVAETRKDRDTSPPKLIHGHEATLGYTISFPRSDKLKGKTPAEIKQLIKQTKHSYLINVIQARNKELLAYEDDEESLDDE